MESNPLSIQDDVSAALVEREVQVSATHDPSDEEFERYLPQALEVGPELLIDDEQGLYGDRFEIVDLTFAVKALAAHHLANNAARTRHGLHTGRDRPIRRPRRARLLVCRAEKLFISSSSTRRAGDEQLAGAL